MEHQRSVITATTVTVVVIVAVTAAAIGSWSYLTAPQSVPGTTTAHVTRNAISLRDFFLETNSTSPGYPSPYLSGEIFVNASVPWSSYALYSNNTYCGTQYFNTNNTVTQFAYQYKGSPCVPVIAGKTYLISFVVTFADGTNATASASVIAG